MLYPGYAQKGQCMPCCLGETLTVGECGVPLMHELTLSTEAHAVWDSAMI